jgi:hypothetical protein
MHMEFRKRITSPALRVRKFVTLNLDLSDSFDLCDEESRRIARCHQLALPSSARSLRASSPRRSSQPFIPAVAIASAASGATFVFFMGLALFSAEIWEGARRSPYPLNLAQNPAPG